MPTRDSARRRRAFVPNVVKMLRRLSSSIECISRTPDDLPLAKHEHEHEHEH